MTKLLYGPFSEERRMICQCWNEQSYFFLDWLDFLYLMTGRAETSIGELIYI